MTGFVTDDWVGTRFGRGCPVQCFGFARCYVFIEVQFFAVDVMFDFAGVAQNEVNFFSRMNFDIFHRVGKLVHIQFDFSRLTGACCLRAG